MDSNNLLLNILNFRPEEIKSVKTYWKRVHYRAVVNWIVKHQPSSQASNLETVKGYLEACHHIFELKEWTGAFNLLSTHFDKIGSCGLGIQLGSWGYYSEQISLYSNLLGKLNQRTDIACLQILGTAYRLTNNFEQAKTHLIQALNISRTLGELQESSKALYNLGLLEADNGRNPKALSYYESSLVIFKQISNFKGIASVLDGIARVYTTQNRFKEAEKRYQEIQYIYNKHLSSEKESANYAWIIYNLGRNLADQCKNSEAYYYTFEALNLFQDLEERTGVAWSFYSLSILMLNLGKDQQSYEFIVDSLRLFEDLQNKIGIALSYHILGRLSLKQKNYDLAHNCYKDKMKIWLEYQNLVGLAFVLEGFAHLAVSNEQPQRSARLFGCARALREKTQTPLPPSDLPEYRGSIKSLLGLIGKSLFKKEWNSGRLLELDDAIIEALAVSIDR